MPKMEDLLVAMNEPQEPVKPLSDKAKRLIKRGVVCLFLVIFLILQFVIYQIGYHRGWQGGSEVPPERIVIQSDRKAMETLARFMADSAAGPEALEQLLRHKKERLSWIRDEGLRADVTWGLARDLLMETGYSETAIEAVRELLKAYWTVNSAKWLPRAEMVGLFLCDKKHYRDAAELLGWAVDGFKKERLKSQEYHASQALLSALFALNRQDDALNVLKRMYLLTDDPVSKSGIRASMGRIARLLGRNELAGTYFNEALALLPKENFDVPQGDIGMAKISMGEVLMESGKYNEARVLFEEGLEKLHGGMTDRSFVLSAYRGLAQIDFRQGKYQQALARLYQAEGVAGETLKRNDPYWTCLYDQRGWVLFEKNDLKEALADFHKAIRTGSAPDALAQAYEGAGRCFILLGEEKAAHDYLKRALEIRKKHFAEDRVSLARVYHYLGSACDMLGNNREAVVSYGHAADELKQAGREKEPLYADALLCKAYALSEDERWKEAIDVFREVIPRLEGERKVENLKNMATCYDNIGLRDKGDECWREAGFPRVVPAAKKSRR